jgi:hypothetical protein
MKGKKTRAYQPEKFVKVQIAILIGICLTQKIIANVLWQSQVVIPEFLMQLADLDPTILIRFELVEGAEISLKRQIPNSTSSLFGNSINKRRHHYMFKFPIRLISVQFQSAIHCPASHILHFVFEWWVN